MKRLWFWLVHFFLYSYASIGAIFNCYIFGIRLFTGTAEFAWEMLARIFNVHGRGLHMFGFSINQWWQLYRSPAMQMCRIYYLFFIFIGIPLVIGFKFRFMVEFPVSHCINSLNMLWILLVWSKSFQSYLQKIKYCAIRTETFYFLYALCVGLIIIVDYRCAYTKFNRIGGRTLAYWYWRRNMFLETRQKYAF